MYVSGSVVGISGSGKLYMLVVLDICRTYSFCCRRWYFCKFVGLIPSVVYVTVVTRFAFLACIGPLCDLLPDLGFEQTGEI